MAFIPYNPNPYGTFTGDCAIRAVAKATDHPRDDGTTQSEELSNTILRFSICQLSRQLFAYFYFTQFCTPLHTRKVKKHR